MRMMEALSKIQQLNQAIVRTSDICACLKINKSHASKLLSRLAAAKQITHISWGLWGFADKIDLLMLPEVELPKTFDVKKARLMINQLTQKKQQTRLQNAFSDFMSHAN